MIEVKNLSKSFGEKGVLSDLNFSVAHGQSVAIVGKSGAGKSVLLKCLIGLVKPDEGTIYVDNKLINSMNFSQLQEIRSNIGMVFQDYQLLNDRNVFHNVALPLHVMGYNANEIPYRVEEALDLVGFEGKRGHYPDELSGGEKQRVTLARAIVKEPDIILADEPTGNLDPVAAFELVQLLETINNNGTTILMASHNYNLIKGRGRRILELKDGAIRGS